jgi:glycosyltransferase involved in cell wall biosynthesis
MDGMRVVIVNDVTVARGGATALALLEVKLLRELGVSVVFVTGDAGDNPLFGELGVPVVALGGRRLLEGGAGATMSGLYNRRARDLLASRFAQTDTPQTIYHVHGWSQILSPSLFAALAPYRNRLIISAHDFFLACPNGAYADFRKGRRCDMAPLGAACLTTNCDKRSYGHKLWRVLRQALQTRALRFENDRPLALMIHETMREPLHRAGLPDAALQALPNPVTPWSGARIAAEQNREYLFVGRFTLEKGPDLAAAAARRAGASMTLIGDGPMLEPLRRTYPQFSFPGRLPVNEVARRAVTARALVMPSRYPEPYGLVAVEAMWSGLPVLVARDALLAPDIVARGAGLAFDPRDEASFAAALRDAGDDVRLRAMSLNAFARTRDLGFSPAAWAERLVDIFATTLAPRTAGHQPSTGAAPLATLRVEGENAHVFDGQH